MRNIAIMFIIVLALSNTVLTLQDRYSSSSSVPEHPAERYRPLIAGLKIGARYNSTHQKTGSIGFPAYKVQTPFVIYGFVTADHIYSRSILTYQPDCCSFTNFVGFRYYGTENTVADAAFVATEWRYCPGGDPYLCGWDHEILQPRVWQNFTTSGKRVVSYSFIISAYNGDLENLVLSSPLCHSVGYSSETRTGYILGYVLSDIVVKNGRIYKIYMLRTNIPIKHGDSGGFLGMYVTSAGLQLLGIVWGTLNDGYNYFVFYNITNIWGVKPLTCPDPYTCGC